MQADPRHFDPRSDVTQGLGDQGPGDPKGIRRLLYAADWLAFAHIVLAILFAGAARDPVRNVWIVQCGLIMCLGVPILAGVCIPLRGLPWQWFRVDSAFASAAALPLWIALRNIKRAEGRGQ